MFLGTEEPLHNFNLYMLNNERKHSHEIRYRTRLER